MNPLYSALIGSVVRWLVTLAAARGFLLSDDQATQIVMGLIAVAPLAWSGVQKFLERRKLVTALAMDVPMSERSLEFEIQEGNAASAITLKSDVPS